MTSSMLSDIRFKLLVPEFEPDWNNFEKWTYRKSAITGQPVSNSEKNQALHAELGSLSANKWCHGVSKYEKAVKVLYLLKKPPLANKFYRALKIPKTCIKLILLLKYQSEKLK